jgi:diguanylate cyclase (GGDEF)-like protein
MTETVDILNEINGMQNIERTLHDIVQKCADYLKCQTCAVVFVNRPNRALEILNSHGLSWKYCKEFRKKNISSEIEEIIWAMEPVYLKNSQDDPGLANLLKLENDFGSCYCVSLMANHRPLGYLYLDSIEPDHFSPDDLLLIRLYAQIISLAFIKDILQKELQNPSIEDPETGAIRYQYFYGRLQEAVAKAQRLNEQLSVILIDVVKFDNVLSIYGMDTAKMVMSELVQLIKGQIRPYDELSKFGTDEVIISLPGNSPDQARASTDKFYKKIRETIFTDNLLEIDVSIGIANFPANAKDAGGLLTATKNALAEAKRHPSARIIQAKNYY